MPPPKNLTINRDEWPIGKKVWIGWGVAGWRSGEVVGYTPHRIKVLVPFVGRVSNVVPSNLRPREEGEAPPERPKQTHHATCPKCGHQFEM